MSLAAENREGSVIASLAGDDDATTLRSLLRNSERDAEVFVAVSEEPIARSYELSSGDIL